MSTSAPATSRVFPSSATRDVWNSRWACVATTGSSPPAAEAYVASAGRGGEVGPTHPGAQDLSFCPLDETRAIVAPCAWDQAGRATVAALGPEPLVIDEDEAFTFCANSVVVGDVVVMPAGVPARVARRLEAWGFWVQTVDVSELHKGGGSIRCMTLPLDTVLDDARLTRPAPSDMEPVPA